MNTEHTTHPAAWQGGDQDDHACDPQMGWDHPEDHMRDPDDDVDDRAWAAFEANQNRADAKKQSPEPESQPPLDPAPPAAPPARGAMVTESTIPEATDLSTALGASDAAAELQAQVGAACLSRNSLARLSTLERAFVHYLMQAGTAFELPEEGPVWVSRDGRAHACDEALQTLLASIGHAPAGAREVKDAIAGAVRTVCLVRQNRAGQLLRHSAVGNDGRLYLRLSDTEMLRIGPEVNDVVGNGHAGLVIIGRDDFEPVGELPPPSDFPLVPLGRLLGGLFEWEGAGSGLLVLTLAVFLLPKKVVPVVPILLLLGQGGSGKTSLMGGLLQLFRGGTAEVSVPPEKQGQRDFESESAHVSHLALDDPDANLGWFSSFIRAITTGAVRTRRKLYTDKSTFKIKPDVRLLIAANANPFARTYANASRLLPLDARRPEVATIRTEGEIERLLLEARPQFFADCAELFHRAWDDLCGPQNHTAGTRLSGFEIAVHTLLEHIGAPGLDGIVQRHLDAVERARHQLLIEDDLLAEALVSLLDWSDGSWTGTATKLLERFHVDDMRWSKWGPIGLARHLTEIAPSMLAAENIQIERAPRTAKKRPWVITRQDESGEQ